jgi:hypothetical protein
MQFLVPLRHSWHVPCLLDGLIVVLGVQAIRGAQLFGDLKFLGIPRHGNPLTFVPTEETQSLGTPKYLSQKNPGTQLHLEMSPVIHLLKTMPLKQRLEIDAI